MRETKAPLRLKSGSEEIAEGSLTVYYMA